MAARRLSNWWQEGWGIAIFACAAALLLLVTNVPILIDLPAHLSRFHVQTSLPHSPDLARYFTFEWRFIPNLGVDLLVGALTPSLGDELATRLVVALIPAVMIAGMLLTAREIHGRVPWTALFALPLAFSYPFVFGFVNFWLSEALALLGFALWFRLTKQRAWTERTIAFAVIAPIVLLAHMSGYGTLCVIAGTSAIAVAWQRDRRFFLVLREAALAGATLGWPLILLVAWSSSARDTTGMWFDFNRIGIWIVSIVRTKWMAVDLASAVVLYAVALLPLLRPSKFSYAIPLALPALLLAIAVVLLPRQINGSDYASIRLIPIACALAILAVRPLSDVSRWGERAALLFVGTRFAIVLAVLIITARDSTAEISALDYIRRGSRVAAFHISPCRPDWAPRFSVHLQSMATTRRDAMVNDQFMGAAGQLLNLTPAERARSPMPNNDVATPGCTRQAAFDTAFGKINLNQVDYLWLIDRAGIQRPTDPRLHLIWSKPGSVLYRVGASPPHRVAT